MLLTLLLLFVTSSAFSVPGQPPLNVLVTGASGKTGQIVIDLLNKQQEKFQAKALVRSTKSARKLLQRRNQHTVGLDQIIICDVCNETIEISKNKSNFDAMVICTSAVPEISKSCLTKSLIKAPWRMVRGLPAMDFKSVQFVWKNNQYPELVDYHGQVAQIDLAKKLGVKHVVLVSSMGGTDPNNFLNSVGKNNTGHGDILIWKRKAEQYLVESGLDYTIIHPGGLLDATIANNNNKETFVLDVDDKLMGQTKKSISRADVASLCVAALAEQQRGRTNIKQSFDCITQPLSVEEIKKNIPTAIAATTAKDAFRAVLEKSVQYDYSR